jgi:hypothetical protein
MNARRYGRQVGWGLAAALLVATAMAKPAPTPVPAPAPVEPQAPTHRPYHATHPTEGARNYYATFWGVTDLRVRLTSSDNLVKFTWRVVNPKLAQAVGDHTATPEMVALRSNVVLQVPTVEKIGTLRQATAKEAGREYWMVFSNKGHPVRSGDRVNVIIGNFRALDLVVE